MFASVFHPCPKIAEPVEVYTAPLELPATAVCVAAAHDRWIRSAR